MLLTGMWTEKKRIAVSTPASRAIEKRKGTLTQLDNVANNSHDQEAHANGLGNAQELALVSCERRNTLVGLYVVKLYFRTNACVLDGRERSIFDFVASCLEIKGWCAQRIEAPSSSLSFCSLREEE